MVAMLESGLDTRRWMKMVIAAKRAMLHSAAMTIEKTSISFAAPVKRLSETTTSEPQGCSMPSKTIGRKM